MLEISKELEVFLGAIWTGMFVYLIQIFMEISVKYIVKKGCLLHIQDLAYWVWVSIYVYRQIFLYTYGVMRWYFFLGIVLGSWSGYTIWCAIKKVIRIRKKDL